MKFTTSIEECRAWSLTPAAVSGFYNLLENTVTELGIPPENIYNMDEKGIQLGVGEHAAILIDQDQKTVNSVEQGTRDLVMIIEMVCADRTTLHPSVIFEGVRRDTHWGTVNPANARYVYLNLDTIL